MTEKNIFAYKPFLTLNISDFDLFLCENCNPPPEKNHPLQYVLVKLSLLVLVESRSMTFSISGTIS